MKLKNLGIIRRFRNSNAKKEDELSLFWLREGIEKYT